MKIKQFLSIAIFFIGCSNLNAQLQTLWYDKPVKIWTEALPVGNGRLGAMVYGGTAHETIQFNEATLWTGQPHDYAHQGAYKYLADIRSLLWDGKQNEAEELSKKEFMSKPLGQQAYQPFGDIVMDFPGHENVQNYQRKLALDNALSSVNYTVNGVEFKRELFSSFPDQAIIIKISASKAHALNFSVGLNCAHRVNTIVANKNQLVLTGKVNDYANDKYEKIGGIKNPSSEVKFEARLLVENQDGNIVTSGKTISVKGATTVVLKLVAATSFQNYHDISANPTLRCVAYQKGIEGKDYEVCKAKHIADYQALYNRSAIELDKSELSNRPTNVRLNTYSADKDPDLVALLYHYGRYLLISSSRMGGQAANLQGIWNDKLIPSWDSKYTTNINLQMNYWLAEMTNLSECAEPLFSLTKDLAVTGKVVAKEHYNLPGWIFHHNTDIWRGAAPINNPNHGIWMGGSGWLSQHLWWHYEYTGDLKFLREQAYPIMKAAAEFYAAYLVPDPKHPEWLISGPSNSPENGGLVMGPTMDHQIIRDLFTHTIEAGQLLSLDKTFCNQLKSKLAKIAPNQIGRYGQLQEWLEDKDDPTSDHRHVSHLWALHPGSEISPLTTPALAEACKVVLQHRGDQGTGWSRAWKMNFWARLGDGDHAMLMLNNLVVPAINVDSLNLPEKGGLYPNLFDACPPFVIDGNFGVTSGIVEMLLQSHLRNEKGEYYLDILPALPSQLVNGKITGLVARGGFEINITWENHKLTTLTVKSRLGNKINLRYKGKMISNTSKIGEVYKYLNSSF